MWAAWSYVLTACVAWSKSEMYIDHAEKSSEQEQKAQSEQGDPGRESTCTVCLGQWNVP